MCSLSKTHDPWRVVALPRSRDVPPDSRGRPVTRISTLRRGPPDPRPGPRAEVTSRRAYSLLRYWLSAVKDLFPPFWLTTLRNRLTTEHDGRASNAHRSRRFGGTIGGMCPAQRAFWPA